MITKVDYDILNDVLFILNENGLTGETPNISYGSKLVIS
jgi:hypothetical protein